MQGEEVPNPRLLVIGQSQAWGHCNCQALVMTATHQGLVNVRTGLLKGASKENCCNYYKKETQPPPLK